MKNKPSSSKILVKRIAILGNCGSGKTTLGVNLSKILNIPLYHLDQYYYKPNWEKAPFEEYLEIHNTLCKQDKWIIDGTGTRTLAHRLQRADCIIFLDIPRSICLWRVFKRLLINWGKVRFSSASGCKERFNFGFFKWVWNFDKRKFVFFDMFEKLEDKKIYVVKSSCDLKRILDQFKAMAQ